MRRIAVVMLVGATACSSETRQSLQIQGALAPETDCSYDSANGKFLSSGWYDPRGYGTHVPDSYVLALEILNTMVADTTSAVEAANDVVVAGVESCWDLASKHSSPTAFDDGSAFDCSKMPADQRAFVNSVTPVPAGGKAVVIADVLAPANLRAVGIFGGLFDPRNLPTTAVAPTNVIGPSFSLPLTVTADDPSRGDAWGSFPLEATNTARVLVQVRAVGQTHTEQTVKSNWITYPIDVTPGGLAVQCEPTPAILTCPTGATMYAGGFVDVGNSCIPGRGGMVTCLGITEASCPATP